MPNIAVKEDPKDLSKNGMFGELLTFLRNGKNMSLLAIIRSATDFKVEGTNAVIYLEDKETLDMLSQERYNKIIAEFFTSVGFTFTLKVVDKIDKSKDIEKLKNIFGGKLEIKD